MSYCDIVYLAIFLPITMILYSILPKKHRWIVLLLASYVFFWSISKKLIVYILISTGSIYGIGLWLEKLQNRRNEELKQAEKEKKKELRATFLKKQRRVLALGALFNLGILLVLKYTPFVFENLNALFGAIKAPFQLPIPNFLMPIGISFYTLQAIAYLFDVYHEKIKADHNIGRLALFMSFFPQIMEGPICRYAETADQLWEGKNITYKSFKYGILRISYGMIKKVMIADRLDALVKTLFTDYAQYDGGLMVVAMVLYTLQLYMDFSGVLDIVIGSGEIFGIKMPENFKRPFFSKNISEFWTRWHITLGAFFRDYIFYPLSLSEPLKKLTTNARKKLGKHYGPLLASAIALFCVWFCNGLWHGAAWTFIFFGMYHFMLILLGKIFEPINNWIGEKLHINKEHWLYKGFQIVRTTILVFIGELFFEAQSLKAGFEMLGKMFTNFTFASFANGEILNLGMDLHDFIIVAIFTLIIFVIGIFQERGVNIRDKIMDKKIVIRWIIYYAIILSLIIFGAYGENYTPVDPMYANF